MHLRDLCNAAQDAAASKRGVESYLCEAESWKGRRCFKTHALPHLLLGREDAGDGLSIAAHTHKMSQDVDVTGGLEDPMTQRFFQEH